LKSLYKKNPVLHSLVWLAIYLVMNTVTGNIAAAAAIDSDRVGALPNLALAVVCCLYLMNTGIAREIGLFAKAAERPSVMLYYIPLLTLPFLNLYYGLNTGLTAADILILLAIYAGVGFMEEIVFRGLMFQALKKKWNRAVTVVFISLTFAAGHILSMAAVGMSGADTFLQIVNASVVGFMFMAVVLASGNLTVCVIAHVLYNFLANISLVGYTRPEIIGVTAVIAALYFAYLLLCTKHVRAYFRGAE